MVAHSFPDLDLLCSKLLYDKFSLVINYSFVRASDYLVSYWRIDVPRQGSCYVRGHPLEWCAPSSHFRPCALIIGERKESTDLKTSLNEVLREFEVTV